MIPLSADHQGAVMINGESVVSGNALVAADDLGLIRGDGVFDVFRVYQGTPFALEEHLDRLARSAAAVHLDYDRGRLESEVLWLLKRMGAKDGHVRIILTRSGSRLLFEEPLFEFPSRYRLMLVPHAVSPLMAGVKSLSYAVNCHASRLAEESGYDDALFYSVMNEEILECPFASFAWVKEPEVVLLLLCQPESSTRSPVGLCLRSPTARKGPVPRRTSPKLTRRSSWARARKSCPSR